MGFKLRLGGVTDISTVDWYGNVSSVVFFAGCNFRCPYCQNSGLIPAESGQEVSLEQLKERIKSGLSIIDAIVFTGGEPLLQPEGLIEAAKLVKDCGLKLMLDTNGSVPTVVEQLLDLRLIDRVALDVKAPLTVEDHVKVIGLQNQVEDIVENIGRTLELCNRYGVEIEARTTVAPTVSDTPDFIRRIASDIKGKCNVYYLQQFDNTGNVLSPSLKSMAPPSREKLIKLAHAATEEGLRNVYIKTRNMGLEKIE
ncbi:anaerobic ribonucleoside-triphosphate reductase activating protein [Candidatus Bathyarchaeota archaeon]|nr:anaerobic ribonucleoside-triphosphate reductase activating protein [Candidatus Bathyarchaeota archaeon]